MSPAHVINMFTPGRWVTVRVDLGGTVLVTALAIWLLYFAPLSASNTGFSLTMAGASTICYLLMELQ